MYEEVCIDLAVYNVAQMGEMFFPLDYILTVYFIHFLRGWICSCLHYVYSTFEFQLLEYGLEGNPGLSGNHDICAVFAFHLLKQLLDIYKTWKSLLSLRCRNV
jgi:hypothetical protein